MEGTQIRKTHAVAPKNSGTRYRTHDLRTISENLQNFQNLENCFQTVEHPSGARTDIIRMGSIPGGPKFKISKIFKIFKILKIWKIFKFLKKLEFEI